MEIRALAAERCIDEASTKDEALRSAINATEIYMKAVKIASSDADRSRLRSRCMAILERAERIKAMPAWPPPTSQQTQRKKVAPKPLRAPVSTRTLSKSEQRILLDSSRLHGHIFLQWVEDPRDEMFEPLNDAPPFEDAAELSLSATQRKVLSGWERPDMALRRRLSDQFINGSVAGPTMHANESMDLVQDVTTDCSVVASICAGIARAEGAFAPLLSSMMFPYSHDDACPRISKNGKYIFRLNFNGCFREVVIDDRLPVTKSSRTLFVKDRNNPRLLWPALLEKAYLKLRGGYDFPGSNSGTDLWVLTGWIPEQVFLQDDETSTHEVWVRVSKSYGFGDVMLTLGTGRLSAQEEEESGLTGEHDYAVLCLREVNGKKMFLVKNPWYNGEIQKASSLGPSSIHDQWTVDMKDALPPDTQSLSGTFWLPLDRLARHFESMYLNWNPGLFTHRQDHHFTWSIRGGTSPACLWHNPQYVITSAHGGIVWLLLSKHFQTREYDIAKSVAGSKTTPGALGFISLYIFAANGQKVYTSDNALLRGAFVDSPQTLARIEMPKGSCYTVVAVEQDLPLPRYSFTLSLFSRASIHVETARESFTHQVNIEGSWSLRNAGGNSGSIHYASNPQYSITVPSATDMTLVLETSSCELPIHVKLVWADGARVSTVAARDIVGDSGDYKRGFTSTAIKQVMAGCYTVICSTFEAGQIGRFTLSILSMAQCTVKPVDYETAGRLHTTLPHMNFESNVTRLLAPLNIKRLSRISAVARHESDNGAVASPLIRTPIRISVEQGQGPNKTVLARSSKGTFTDALAGARTGDIDVAPAMMRQGGVWLVVERSSDSIDQEVVIVELLSDHQVLVGSWGVGDG